MSTTLAKYRLVTKSKEKTTEEEIRITSGGFANAYIAYGARMLLEKKLSHVKNCKNFKPSGNAIAKACIVAEVLRRRIKNLAQVNQITNITITDNYEPKEDGLDTVTVQRILSVLEIKLSTDPAVLDTNHVGYQAPLDEKEISEFPHDFGGRRSRGTGRGGGRRGGGDRRGRGFRRGGGGGFGGGGFGGGGFGGGYGGGYGGRRGQRGDRGGGRRGRGGNSPGIRSRSREPDSGTRRGGRGNRGHPISPRSRTPPRRGLGERGSRRMNPGGRPFRRGGRY